jgi:transcriptional regulator with XRE-family HTH domain
MQEPIIEDSEFRNEFVADHVRTRLALLIRTLREQRGWSQAELGRRMGKPQSVVSRIEDPDYGKLSTQTLFEVAAALGLPVYIDLPNWDEWFRLMEDMSSRNLQRREFNVEQLIGLSHQPASAEVAAALAIEEQEPIIHIDCPAQ